MIEVEAVQNPFLVSILSLYIIYVRYFWGSSFEELSPRTIVPLTLPYFSFSFIKRSLDVRHLHGNIWLYTNDQPVHADTRSFIYADDLCIASQGKDFNNIEATLTSALSSMTTYYAINQLRANPSKTQVRAFHPRNRETLNESWISSGTAPDSTTQQHQCTLVFTSIELSPSRPTYKRPRWK